MVPTSPSYHKKTPSTQTPTLQLNLHLITKNQNLFSNISPDRTTILIHACNTRGVWGAGVAKEMKRRFPEAYGAYRAFCLEAKEKRKGKVGDEDELVGQCMITLVPSPVASNPRPGTTTTTSKIIIANLFTRSTYGPLTPQDLDHLDSLSTTNTYTARVFNATRSSLSALLGGLVDLHTQGILNDQDIRSLELRMPKINSGRFMVDWDSTRACLEGVAVPKELGPGGWRGGVVVCCLDDEER